MNASRRFVVSLLVVVATLTASQLATGEAPAPGPTLSIALTGGGAFTPGAGDKNTVDYTITNKQTTAFNSIAIMITNGPNKLSSGTCPDGFTADLKHTAGWLYCVGAKADAVAVGGAYKGTLTTAAAGGWSEAVGGIYADAYGVNEQAATAPAATAAETPEANASAPPAKQADLAVSVTLTRTKIRVPVEKKLGKEILPSQKATYSVTVSNKGPDAATDAVFYFYWRFQYGARLADPTSYSWFAQYSQKTPEDVTCTYREAGLDYRCVIGELKSGGKRVFGFGLEIQAANQNVASKQIDDNKENFGIMETTAKTTAGQATRAWEVIRQEGLILSVASVTDEGETKDPVHSNNVSDPNVTLEFVETDPD